MKRYSDHELIEIMLTSLVGKSIIEQLGDRGVRKIALEDYGQKDFATGCISPPLNILYSDGFHKKDFTLPKRFWNHRQLYPFYQSRSVYLNKHDKDNFRAWELVLWHEIGHTFELGIHFGFDCLERSFITSFPDNDKGFFAGKLEDFCDAFSEAWSVTHPDKTELHALFRKLRDEGTVVFVP